jgi:hydrogenase nickel incorporation protein HypA/HybF
VHEFSIAEALAEQVVRHAPASGRVREVEVRVGALRGLDPEAMTMCWDAVTHATALAGSTLVMDMRPWSLACPACGRVWESRVPFVDCTCGETAPRPTADDELLLVAISVEDEEGEVPVPSEATEARLALAPAPQPAEAHGR